MSGCKAPEVEYEISLEPGKVLVVDDGLMNRTLLRHHLGEMGHLVDEAENGRQALDMIEAVQFDLVLLDLTMPEMDGHEVLQVLRHKALLGTLPVVVISSHEEVSVAASCIELGAEDYLNKPFDPRLLRARVNACLEKKRLRDAEKRHLRELTELRHDLEIRNRELQAMSKKFEKMAFTDALTGLPNRRFALEHVTQLWELFRRSEQVFACTICDVDHFKQINDGYGHECGDQVLVQVAARLRSLARACDQVCRFGGEEFLVISPATDLEGGRLLAERLRTGLEGEAIEYPGFNRSITASFGVAQADPGMERADLLLKAADEALYGAKEKGRNCVGTAAP